MVYAAGSVLGLLTGRAGLFAAFFAAGTVAILAVIYRSRRALAIVLLFASGVAIGATTPPPPPRWQPSHGTLEPVRSELGRRIDRIFGQDAQIARALLIADQRQLPMAVRDRYAAAGLVHMLSISGLHVAIIAGSIELLLLAMRLRRGVAIWLSVALVLGYVAVLDWRAPALRAAVMYGTLSVARGIQRPTSPWAALAIGAWIPLIRPRVVLDIGYQLSICGMIALTAAGFVMRKRFLAELTPVLAGIARSLIGSTFASITTAPLVAWHFGRMSLIGPAANLLAGPVISVLQPALFLGLVLSPLETASLFVADAARPLLRIFDRIAASAASVPLAAADLAPTLTTVVVASFAVAAFTVACAARRPGRPLAACCLAVGVGVWIPVVPAPRGQVELHMLDVGQGDALALRTDRGNWVLFDAGRAWARGDAGRAVVVPYVRRRGGNVVAFVLSHPHMDHVGGAASVVRWLRPRELWDPAYVGMTSSYADALTTVARSRVEWKRVHPGASVRADGVEILFLAPDSAWAEGLSDPNEASTIALVTYGRVRFLLTGDAESAEEAWLMRNAAAMIDVDVLKVAHHGSSTSSTEGFVAAATPRVALISVGAENAYGHPSPAVLERFARHGIPVLRTDMHGTVIVRTDGQVITTRSAGTGEAWILPAESPDR